MVNKINSTILFSVSLLFSVAISYYKSNKDLIDCNNYSESTKIYCSINHLENSNYVLKYIS